MSDDNPNMTLLQRLDSWLELSKYNPDRPDLLEHMGMTLDEFVEWRQGLLPPVLPEEGPSV